MKYLQTWLGAFLEDRMDLVRELEQLAERLGGRLQAPRLRWKYYWIEKLFGRPAANRVRQNYNRCKSLLLRSWDKGLYYVERCKPAPQRPQL